MDDRQPVADLASPEAAHAVAADLGVDAGTEDVPLDDAGDRVLAERVTADRDVPGFDRARMDGYAVRATDTAGADADPVTLDVVGHLDAGQKPPGEVGPGEAMGIATGAVLPPGADAVVIVEETSDAGEGRVELHAGVDPGENVMPAGADLAAGDWVLGAGTRLTPRTIGLLAALGRERVTVRGAPRVGVVTTGGELVAPGGDLDEAAGQVYDVNTETLGAAIRDAGGDPRYYRRTADDPGALRAVLREAAADCDLVLTSGSTSAGAKDVLTDVADDAGEVLLHGIAIKPGKPTIMGRIDGTPYVGLPGYPVSGLSIFRLFVAPLLREATGRAATEATLTGTLAIAERYTGDRHRAVPVGLVEDGSGDPLVYPVDRGSGATTSLGFADGVVEMPAETDELPVGQRVTVELFAGDTRPPALLCVGEPDPVAATLLDGVERPRYLPRGSAAGERWLREGVADVAFVTGEPTVDGASPLATWEREWGLAMPAGNPDGVESLADLEDGPQFANLAPELGLRDALEAALDRAGGDDLRGAVRGYGVETRGIESPARRVADGRAGVGPALRETAAALDLAFLPLGTQSVAVLAADDRRAKAGVAALEVEAGAHDTVTVEQQDDT